MIEQLRNLPGNVLGFVCHGRVTRAEYDSVLVPAVHAALGHPQQLRFYYETAADFSGIEPGAIWEDFKVGIDHLTRWERIAVVTDVEWIRHTVRFFGFLMPGAVRVYSGAQAAQARAWLTTA